MITIRVGTVLLLAALASAQNTSASKVAGSNIAEPELPVIDYSGDVAIAGSTRIVTKRSTIYDTWRENRKAIGQLSDDERVHEFGSLCITRKPDRFLVRKANPDFALKTGDMILQYQHWGEGKTDIWANGGWHRDFDWPVLKTWDLTLVEPGVREWWVRVSREDGTTGWVLVQGNLKLGYLDSLFSASPDQKVGSKIPLTTADIPAPKLPMIDYSACPGDGRIVSDWIIERDDRMYSSFQDGRTVVATLKAGEKVTVLGGANLVREPDRAVIKYIAPYDDPSLL
jgi:hypothetical protein